MSSGWNGIGIKSVGKTRRKLADLICQLTGMLVMPEDLKRSNPSVRHWEDCLAWDCYATKPAIGTRPAYKVHIYSWDTMGACVKNGIELVKDDYTSTGGISLFDLEISAK